MRSATAFFIANLFACLFVADAHKPGEELTYLNMFLKPPAKEALERRERAHFASQFMRNADLHGSSHQRRLHGRNGEAPEEEARELANTQSEEEQVADSEGDAKRQQNSLDASSEANDESRDDGSASNDDSENAENDSENSDGEASKEEGDMESDEKGSVTDQKQSTDSPPSLKRVVRAQAKENELETELQAVSEESERHGEDIQRVSLMLMKLLRQYEVRSLVDVPCRAHAHWMPVFLKHVAARHKQKLEYFCVDTNRDILKAIQERVEPELVAAKFLRRRFWTEALPRADVVFSWAGLDNMKEENVVRYLEKLGRAGRRHRFVFIGSHSGKLEKEGSRDSISRFTMGGRPINLRRTPFKLRKPMRIVGELSKGGNDKQLYIYKPDEMLAEEE